jgi:hypothetical protein
MTASGAEQGLRGDCLAEHIEAFMILPDSTCPVRAHATGILMLGALGSVT